MIDHEQQHAADRLLGAIERAGAPVCVGIDPVQERLPPRLRSAAMSVPTTTAAIEQFCEGLLESVHGVVPAVKFQSACFERQGSGGVEALERLIARARQLGLIVIADAKRGDIGISAEHYAAAAFEQNAHRSDWITINSYLGEDGITPFIKDAAHGAFALARTSNPGGDAIQTARLESGGTVAEHIARLISAIGESNIGERGYSNLGAVVGATRSEDAAALRAIMPRQIFLVPGFGAQGGGADDIRACFNHDGRGAIITASRSVIYAFEKHHGEGDDGWQDAVHTAAREFAQTVREVV